VLDFYTLPDELYCNAVDSGQIYTSELELSVFENSSELDSYYDTMCLNGAMEAVWMLSETASIEQEFFLGREVPKAEADEYAAALGEFNEAKAFSCNN
jgi:hypothetical protein